MKCVDKRIALFSFSPNNKSQMKRLADTSIPEVGSSRITIFEPPINAMPTYDIEREYMRFII